MTTMTHTPMSMVRGRELAAGEDSKDSKSGKNFSKYDEVLTSLYTDPSKPSSYSSITNLYKYAKQIFPDIRLKDVRDFLERSKTWTSFKKPRFNFPRRKMFVAYPNETWALDTAHMESLKAFNSGFSYLLFVLDVFSRFLWVRPFKSKKNTETIEVFRSIVQSAGVAPIYCHTDKGTELNFLTPAFREFEIVRYSTHSGTKSFLVERVILSIKRWLWKAMIEKSTLRYIDLLQDVVYAYNHRIHKSLFNLCPADAIKPENFQRLKKAFLNEYRDYDEKFKNKPPKFKVNDVVRLLKERKSFNRGYKQTFSSETYKISKVFRTSPYTYGIPHFQKKFYEWELSKTTPSHPHYYIDEIEQDSATLRSGRVKNIQKRFLIKDKNDVTFSKWVDENDLNKFEHDNDIKLNTEQRSPSPSL